MPSSFIAYWNPQSNSVVSCWWRSWRSPVIWDVSKHDGFRGETTKLNQLAFQQSISMIISLVSTHLKHSIFVNLDQFPKWGKKKHLWNYHLVIHLHPPKIDMGPRKMMRLVLGSSPEPTSSFIELSRAPLSGVFCLFDQYHSPRVISHSVHFMVYSSGDSLWPFFGKVEWPPTRQIKMVTYWIKWYLHLSAKHHHP